MDRSWSGADRIAANGDVANKVGTYALAVLADRHGVPFYVAAPVSTIDPATPPAPTIPIEERDPAESVGGGDAFNPAFDVTPAELVTAIVTEAGVLEPPYYGLDRAGANSVTADLRGAASRPPARWLRGGARGAHIRQRVRPRRRLVLITPASTPYERMAADDLVALALDGEPADGAGEPWSEWRVPRRDLRRAARRGRGSPTPTACMRPRGASPATRSAPERRRPEPAARGAVVTAPFAPTGSEESRRGGAALGDRRAAARPPRRGRVGATPGRCACHVRRRRGARRGSAWLIRR